MKSRKMKPRRKSPEPKKPATPAEAPKPAQAAPPAQPKPSPAVRKGEQVVNIRVSQAELARIFGLQSAQVILLAQPGGPLRGFQGDDALFVLGDSVQAYCQHLRDKSTEMKADIKDLKGQVELEKAYYVRQKRLADRLRVKKAVAMSVAEAMVGAVARLKDKIRKLPIEQQQALVSIYDEVEADIKRVNCDKAATDADDPLPDSDIAEELDTEMKEEFGEEE